MNLKTYLDSRDYFKLVAKIYKQGYSAEDCGEDYNNNLYDFVWEQANYAIDRFKDDMLGVHKYGDIPYIIRQSMIKDFVTDPLQLANELEFLNS